MKLATRTLEERVGAALSKRGIGNAAEISWACAWLEACGYPGAKLLAEALADPTRELTLSRDTVGFDLQNVSCVFLAAAIMADVAAHGRVFLRNVRHGLYLLPFAVRDNQAIGCPIDPAFAVGGARTKNPYAEKLALSEANGLEIDATLWSTITD